MKQIGNTILMTGGGSGIGAALAQRFHDRGNTVIVAGRRIEALRRASAGRLLADHPALNVLVNNAGIMRFEALDRSRDLADAEGRFDATLAEMNARAAQARQD